MGQARFMVYTGFIFLTARPWVGAVHGLHGFFNRAAMGRARFMVYMGFFFRRFVVDQTQTFSARLRMTQLMMFIRLLPFSAECTIGMVLGAACR